MQGVLNRFIQANQDIRVGGRISKAQFHKRAPRARILAPSTHGRRSFFVLQELRKLPQLKDVTSDQQTRGLQTNVVIDRDAAARLWRPAPEAIDNTLYDAFGQRQVSDYLQTATISITSSSKSNPGLPARARFAQPDLRQIDDPGPDGAAEQRREFQDDEYFAVGQPPGAVPGSHDFLQPRAGGLAGRGDRTCCKTPSPRAGHAERHHRQLHQGTAQVFQASLHEHAAVLLGAALVVVYIVLGIPPDSLIHPITILSTLPSAGLGALLALMLTGYDLSLVSFIGIILLMGIVKKNAIMMVDFAIEAERTENLPPGGSHLPGLRHPLPAYHDDHAGRNVRRRENPLAIGMGIGPRSCASRSASRSSAA